ncbi:hypothetical protein M422DRAFT_260310 [Sphaerobolus stellatus SS14]|uniref:Ricin B lectin domain-containing protein n=1 Tax=Sphaerobolus stellatus (strain SS14) TaxID=990650 RepID=A0A0C9UQX0_SPHS4|nr:hypothetical protein M422DRAFT_260310 [Sphaerobolus stellatus SS14]
MFKLSPLFVALLVTVAYASPAINARSGGPPENENICNPSASTPGGVWQAEDVTTGNFGFVDLATKTNATSGQALNNQLWAIQTVNHGNFAIVSGGPTSNVCINGDGGPLDSFQCPDIFTAEDVVQAAQFFITCQNCASNNKGATRCQIQSANEGQCVSFLTVDESKTIELVDCSSRDPNQFWSIVAQA